ncbi:MAG: AI-2E family transporter [Ruminococcus sp.]|nr:AI-2E family transporter [Ruminococcus sp.]
MILLVILFTIGIIFFFIHITDVVKVLNTIFAVLAPILYGLVIAYLLNYPYKAFYDHAFKKMGTKHKWLKKIKKPLSLLLAYIIIFGIVGFLVGTLIPELSSSVTTLIDNIPVYENAIKSASDSVAQFVYNMSGYNLYEVATYSNLISLITGNDTTEFIKNVMTNIVPSAFSTVMGIGTGLYNWIIGIIISIYLLSGKEKLIRQFKLLVVAYTPEKFYKRLFKVGDVFNNKCGKFIVGKIIDSSIIGLMCFIGLSIFRFHYPLLISVIIGVSNMIPFFGPIIGAIPTTFLLLIINPMEALGFLIFIIILQQFDGNILGPKILGETVGISGFWIMVSVIVGGGLFGVPGMLLGVPIFAAIYTLVDEGVTRRLRKKEIAANDVAPAVEEDVPKSQSKNLMDPIIGKAAELLNNKKSK